MRRIERTLLLLTATFIGGGMAFGQTPDATAAADATALNIPMTTNYFLLATAVIQVIVILSLSGIIRTIGAPGGAWARRAGGAGVLLFALMAPGETHAATPMVLPLMSSTSLFWWLVAVNLLLFIVVLVQLNFVRGMASALNGPRERTEARKEEHGFAQNVLERLTRSVDVAHEEDVLMHHDYDGIRELDNVLPPWWLWLFYGTIIWGVVYVINVHVIHVWPDQRTAYEQEMAQAKADVAAYMANFANLVDENTAKELTDESSIAQGKAIFTSLCTACHGPNAAGFEGSVGPNLTDGYWLHGGGIRNVFHTITYGVPEKGMISWKDQLKPSEIQLVASFILSQKGQVEGGKAPQGELWEPAPASTDSTAAPAPSAVTDSSAVAQM